MDSGAVPDASTRLLGWLDTIETQEHRTDKAGRAIRRGRNRIDGVTKM